MGKKWARNGRSSVAGGAPMAASVNFSRPCSLLSATSAEGLLPLGNISLVAFERVAAIPSLRSVKIRHRSSESMRMSKKRVGTS